MIVKYQFYICIKYTYIKFINTYEIENLFGSTLHCNVVKVCGNIYDDYCSVLNCNNLFWINIVKFCIFENILYNDKDYFLQVKGIPMGS